MRKILNGKQVLLKDGYHKADLIIEDGIFKEIIINENNSSLNNNEELILPGFIDIHTHGANGLDFSTVKTKKEVLDLVNFYLKHGVTSIYPTLLTEHDELIFNQLELLYEASKETSAIKGIHLEGPFLSKEYKGAQLEECLQIPTKEKVDLFIEKSHGLFAYMTLAPELPNSEEVIKYLVSKGIKVSLGHSAATFDETKKALEAGASSITHCMNAMKGIHQHFPSILTAALYFDDLYTEVILDGIHVHPEMVEFIRKIKTTDKVIGVSDSLMAAGLPDGDYFIGNTAIVVKDHDCKIKESGVRAGSTLILDQGFKNVKKFSSLSDLDASKITSLNASKMLNRQDLGSIEVNKIADFIILNKEDYAIKEVYLKGEKVF